MLFLTPRQLAERWQCSARHVRRLCRSGELRAMRLGLTAWRIALADVEAFERRATASEPAPVGVLDVNQRVGRPPVIEMDIDYAPVFGGAVPWRSTVLPERPASRRGARTR